MKSPITPFQAQSWETIKNRLNSASVHRESFAIDAVICGQMCLEKRHELTLRLGAPTGGKSFYLTVEEAEGAEPDTTWDEIHAAVLGTDKPRQTLRRWAGAAERVTKHLLGKHPTEDYIPTTLLSETGHVLISQVMVGTEDFLRTLPAPAQTFREQFDAFMVDKTFTDAVIAVSEGFDPAKRISLAAAGKLKGGKGEEHRKDYPLFAGWDLQTFSKHLRHWPVMNQGQRAEMAMLVRAWILGGSLNLAGRKEANFTFSTASKAEMVGEVLPEKPLPAEILQVMREAIREAGRQPARVDD